MSGNQPALADILPLALLQVCCTPWAKIGFSPFEILYRRPPPLIKLKGDIKELENLEIQKQLQGLGKTILTVHKWVTGRIPISLGRTLHPHRPRDQVWIKDWKRKPLKASCQRPYLVILTTPTALKIAGLNTWIHHSQVKTAHPPKDGQSEWKITPHQDNPFRSL